MINMKSLWLASVLLSTDPRPHHKEVRENVVRVKREAVCALKGMWLYKRAKYTT